MKTLRTILFIAVADALLVLAALLLVAGYRWQAAAVGVATLAAVALAAWLSRSKPAPAKPTEWHIWDEPLPPELSPAEQQMLRYGYITDPVIAHADVAHSRGEPGWPERHHLEPRRPDVHRRHP